MAKTEDLETCINERFLQSGETIETTELLEVVKKSARVARLGKPVLAENFDTHVAWFFSFGNRRFQIDVSTVPAGKLLEQFIPE